MEEIVFVAPVYNEAGNLEAFCDEWVPLVRGRGQLLLVDDGSTDGSAALADALARRYPEISVLHKANGGHGSAILMGYRQALDRDPDWVFQVDSDRQFDPGDFERLWSLRNQADFIVGVRALRQDHRVRIALSAVHRKLLHWLFGVRLDDPNAPYRLMRAALMRGFLNRIPDGTFAPNVFLSLEFARSGRRIIAVPVSHRQRPAGQVSIRGWKTLLIGLRCFRELWRYRRQGQG